MPKHLEMLDRFRIQLLRDRAPAGVINQISRIYLQALEDSEKRTRETADRR